MKKHILLLSALLFLSLSCQKERVLNWPANVDEMMEGFALGQAPETPYTEVILDGSFELRPDVSYGYCLLPDIAAIPMYNHLSLAGELSVFGELNPKRSYQENEECTLVPEAGMVTTMVVGILYNEAGEALHYYGDALCFEDGRYDGKFYISGGTGAFTDATGWLSLEMVLTPRGKVWQASVEGELLLPKA